MSDKSLHYCEALECGGLLTTIQSLVREALSTAPRLKVILRDVSRI